MRSLAVWPALLAISLVPASAADSARIYVYEQRPAANRSWLPIFSGGVAAAALKEGMFFAMDVPPGRYSVAPEGGVPAFIELKTGEDAFLRLDWNQQVGRPPIPVVGAVAADRARKEIQNLAYIDAKRILSPSVLRADPRPPDQPQLKRRRSP